MKKEETPAQNGAGKKKADEFMRLTQEGLSRHANVTEQVQLVEQAIERSYKMQQKESDELAALYEAVQQGIDVNADCRFDMTAPDKPDDFRLSIGGIGIVPSGGITAVSGQAKQGKTQFLVAMTAVMMSGRPFGSMKRETPPNRVLWIDTEQDERPLKKSLKRLYHLAGIPQGTPSEEVGLDILALRRFSAAVRLARIQFETDKYDPDVIVIDGIGDLLRDFNDLVDSRAVVDWLMANCFDRNIFVIIHTNEGTNKMRGHLGTEVKNKCSDQFVVSLSKGHFEATHVISRDRLIPEPFSFKFGTDGNLVPVDDLNADTQAPGIAGDPDKALEAIFEGGKFLKFDKLRREFANRVCVTQREAADYIKQHYVGTRLLQDNEGLWYLAFSKIS